MAEILTPQQKALAAIVIDKDDIDSIANQMRARPGDALIPLIKGDLSMLPTAEKRAEWREEVIRFLMSNGAPPLVVVEFRPNDNEVDEKDKAANLAIEIAGKRPKGTPINTVTYNEQEIRALRNALEKLDVESSRLYQQMNEPFIRGRLGKTES